MCNLPRNTAQSVTQQKEKDYSKGSINPWWQGWLDSNQRMRESKSLALPLGYTPVLPVFPGCHTPYSVYKVACACAVDLITTRS